MTSRLHGTRYRRLGVLIVLNLMLASETLQLTGATIRTVIPRLTSDPANEFFG